ncbi:MAG: nucleoside-diphosphate kinase [Deltaproteobacteria bacterium]|nr:nucleoside-diphosphate kinase [Deltaproteobacteria bacterium]
MEVERTLGLIKPDAYAKGVVGRILARAEEAGLTIVALKTVHWTRDEAAGFYAVHKERPFFGSLVEYMTSGPVVAVLFEGPDAIKKWRDLMGPTDATKAPTGTLRGDYGTSIEANATHGSDASETAAFEIGYLFSGFEQVK